MNHLNNPPNYEELYGQGIQLQQVQVPIQSQQQIQVGNQSQTIIPQQTNAENQSQSINQAQNQSQPISQQPIQIRPQLISLQQIQLQNQCQMILHIPYQPNSQTVYEINLRDVQDKDACVTVCRNCHHTIMTKTQVKPKIKTHACAVGLFFVGLVPCCCVPYCMRSCNNVDHYCPKCNAYLGSYGV